MASVRVISLGGSIVAPGEVDVAFLTSFHSLLTRTLEADQTARFILVVGGGGPARAYQSAYRQISGGGSDDEADWIGIAATRLNGQLLAAVFSDSCREPVVTDPTEAKRFEGRVLVAAGWKPGFSTDYDAVLLAERFHADTVVNLSNIPQVYSADPKIDPQAKPIDRMSWSEFRALVGESWEPGKNAPFDPIASRRAAELGLEVVVASGRDIANLERLLAGEGFLGTVIGPQ